MTTIATNGKVIAADSRITGDYIDSHPKLFQIGDSVFGIAGMMTRVLKVIDWLSMGCPESNKPDVNDDGFTLLQVCSEGIFYWDGNLRPVQMRGPYAAIGSGSQYAMGAMHAGKNPRRAVEICCELDESTAPPIVVMRVPR